MATVKKQLREEFGLIKSYPSTVIDYEGSGLLGITIRIEAKGPASGLRINNVSRGEFLIIDSSRLKAIAGRDISLGDVIIIKTGKGEKSVTLSRDGTSYNILHAIDTSSKWIYLQHGPNEFTVTAEQNLDNLFIQVNYQQKVLGI